TLDAAIILSRGPSQGVHAVRLDFNMVHAIASKEVAEKLGDSPDVDLLSRQTFLIHNELPESFRAWKDELALPDLEPAAIDHYDSGQLMLEAAAQGLGIAIMHDDHLKRAGDRRLTNLYGVSVESPYSYWFICKPTALEERPVRLFHDWLGVVDTGPLRPHAGNRAAACRDFRPVAPRSAAVPAPQWPCVRDASLG
ncbi:MAG: hypothetical protein DI637_00405, partial [Citromicrobium sp.]